MTALAERLRNKYFNQEHPYRIFEQEIERLIRPHHVLLDAGCGRNAPILSKFKGKADRLLGVDLVDFSCSLEGMDLFKSDLGSMPFPSSSIDIAMARSVMEHVTDPAAVYAEMRRVLKPGGYFVFLTANLWDYASLIAKLVPNRFHPWIVARTEGRAEQDVFPTAYRTNTRRSVCKWANQVGFETISFRYLGQYPSYLMFNGLLFLLGTAYEKAIANISWLNFLQGWIFVVLRKPGPAR